MMAMHRQIKRVAPLQPIKRGTTILAPEARVLTPDECAALRNIRLEALWYEGSFFASSYDSEVLLPTSHWLQWCNGSQEQCAIGLFNDHEMVGATAISTWKEDFSGRTALFGRSYIRIGHRGRGLSAYLYKARLLWAKNNPKFHRAVVFHREGNSLSQHINMKFGAKYWRTIPMQWGDGQIANGLWYKVSFSKN